MSWEEVLERSRRGADPEPSVRERVRARLVAGLAASSLGGSTLSRAQPVASPPLARVAPIVPAPRFAARPLRLPRPWLGKAVWAALGVGAGFVMGRVSSLERPAPPDRGSIEGPSAAGSGPQPSGAGDAGQPLPPVPGDVSRIARPPALPRAATATPPKRSTPRRTNAAAKRGEVAVNARAAASPERAEERSPVTDADRLREALAYLQRAHAALRAGEPSAALGWLSRLDRRVPSEVLEEERAVTLALALCDRGEPERAGQVARRLLSRSPASVYARSLAESCAGSGHLLDELGGRTSKP